MMKLLFLNNYELILYLAFISSTIAFIYYFKKVERNYLVFAFHVSLLSLIFLTLIYVFEANEINYKQSLRIVIISLLAFGILIFILYVQYVERRTERLKKITPPLIFRSIKQFFNLHYKHVSFDISSMRVELGNNQPEDIIRINFYQGGQGINDCADFCYDFYNFSENGSPWKYEESQLFIKAEIHFDSKSNPPFFSRFDTILEKKHANVFDTLLRFGKLIEKNEGYYKFEFKGEHNVYGVFIYEFIKWSSVAEMPSTTGTRWKLIISKA
ncbi:MAG: hypothetical protein V2A54_12535 [Bacteroidota bacterium]